MSYVRNVGEINVCRRVTDEAEKLIKEVLENGFYRKLYSVNGSRIELEEYCDQDFCETAKLLVSKLAPLGYILNGNVEYYGDWDGMIVITNNKIIEYDSDQWTVKQTPDNELIEELVSRGYKVTKEVI